jgi:hypothetical protein
MSHAHKWEGVCEVTGWWGCFVIAVAAVAGSVFVVPALRLLCSVAVVVAAAVPRQPPFSPSAAVPPVSQPAMSESDSTSEIGESYEYLFDSLRDHYGEMRAIYGLLDPRDLVDEAEDLGIAETGNSYLGLAYDPIDGEAPETIRWRETAGRVRYEERTLRAIDSDRSMCMLIAELKRGRKEFATLKGILKRRRLASKGPS